MEKRRLFVLSFLWMLFVPIGVTIVYQVYTPSHSLLSLDIFAFLLLAVLVSLFPIMVNRTPIFFLQTVTLAVFLLYGLFIELIITQIAIIILLVKLTFGKEDAYRIPLNSLMFFFISSISGIVFYTLKGSGIWEQHESIGAFVSISGYVITYFLLNQLFIIGIRRLLYKQKVEVFSRDFLWESVSSLIVFPIGVALYMLYNVIGEYALFVIGIPLISLAIILRMYYSSLQKNAYLKKVHNISLQMSKELQVDQVIAVFQKQIAKLFTANVTYIYPAANSGTLHLYIKTDANDEAELLPIFQEIAQKALKENQSFLFNRRKEWRAFLSDETKMLAVESIMVIPIRSSTKTKGILIVASNRKHDYEKYKKTILDILCSNFAIALENAKHHEVTKRKSQYCALTGVYNYGYFEELLKTNFDAYQKGQLTNVALVLLDLDFFKDVNDTYGHESGNDILCQVTNRIQKVVGDRGTIARYGGEEFVILCTNLPINEVHHIAENVRLEIADHLFKVKQDMQDLNEIKIHVTASIGVAEANREDEDALALVRYADRAMYNGAKRAGRNRVAVYE